MSATSSSSTSSNASSSSSSAPMDLNEAVNTTSTSATSATSATADMKGLGLGSVDVKGLDGKTNSNIRSFLDETNGEKKDVKDTKDTKDTTSSSKKDAGSIQGLDFDASSEKKMKLSAKDKQEFMVERKSSFISTLVKTSLENDDKAEEVPIPGVMGSTLSFVIDYMKEHKGVEPPIIEKPLRSKVMMEVCPHKWDADFIDKIGHSRQALYDLILAANYMDIKSLLHLGCAKVASMIKGQPLEKIKELLDPQSAANRASAAAYAKASGAAYGAKFREAYAAALPAAMAENPAPKTDAKATPSATTASAPIADNKDEKK